MGEKIRRINLMSGPGAGKSITAANVRAQLGFKGYDIELVEEVIKDWTYLPRTPTGSDSIFLQASQIQKEDIRLRAGVDLVVTDSPVLLQYFYAWHHNAPMASAMYLASVEFDKLYGPLNILIEREEKFYSEVGRYENLKEAKEVDFKLKMLLRGAKVPYKKFSCLDQDGIIDYIISEVQKNDDKVTNA